MGRDLETPKGIPPAYEIFSPLGTDNYIRSADEQKKFYSNRLDVFSKEVQSQIQADSSFVKYADSSYMVAGKVKKIDTIVKSGLEETRGYSILLKNSTNNDHIEILSAEEAISATVFLKELTSMSFTKREIKISDIQVGDYILINRITNLLNPEEINIEIDILRNRD